MAAIIQIWRQNRKFRDRAIVGLDGPNNHPKFQTDRLNRLGGDTVFLKSERTDI